VSTFVVTETGAQPESGFTDSISGRRLVKDQDAGQENDHG